MRTPARIVCSICGKTTQNERGHEITNDIRRVHHLLKLDRVTVCYCDICCNDFDNLGYSR